jgi:hypothetical protein
VTDPKQKVRILDERRSLDGASLSTSTQIWLDLRAMHPSMAEHLPALSLPLPAAIANRCSSGSCLRYFRYHG